MRLFFILGFLTLVFSAITDDSKVMPKGIYNSELLHENHRVIHRQEKRSVTMVERFTFEDENQDNHPGKDSFERNYDWDAFGSSSGDVL
jgi:hypothetical protein